MTRPDTPPTTFAWSRRGGPVGSNGGVAVATPPIARVPAGRAHTLLIAGAEEAALRRVMADRRVRRWITRCAAAAARFGSVCSGCFVLASLGLLDGRRVATRWEACVRLDAARAPLGRNLPLKAVAARIGLSPIRLNALSSGRFGIVSRLFRAMHPT
jgi:transcriptional regulator GlxA family with amidase domain